MMRLSGWRETFWRSSWHAIVVMVLQSWPSGQHTTVVLPATARQFMPEGQQKLDGSVDCGQWLLLAGHCAWSRGEKRLFVGRLAAKAMLLARSHMARRGIRVCDIVTACFLLYSR